MIEGAVYGPIFVRPLFFTTLFSLALDLAAFPPPLGFSYLLLKDLKIRYACRTCVHNMTLLRETTAICAIFSDTSFWKNRPQNLSERIYTQTQKKKQPRYFGVPSVHTSARDRLTLHIKERGTSGVVVEDGVLKERRHCRGGSVTS